MDNPLFLRWIGGKSKIVQILGKFVPVNFERYWEPFLGGGSMFFLLKPQSSFLSDSNKDLIACYEIVRDNPIELSQQLESHRNKHSKEYYYQIREEYNLGCNKIEQASKFIYLNKACFNGIYRVNKQGKYNVPYGSKVNPSIPIRETLLSASSILQRAELACGSYESILLNHNIATNDFIYLDPPYPPLNGTSNFIHYTQERFISKDHFIMDSQSSL